MVSRLTGPSFSYSAATAAAWRQSASRAAARKRRAGAILLCRGAGASRVLGAQGAQHPATKLCASAVEGGPSQCSGGRAVACKAPAHVSQLSSAGEPLLPLALPLVAQHKTKRLKNREKQPVQNTQNGEEDQQGQHPCMGAQAQSYRPPNVHAAGGL